MKPILIFRHWISEGPGYLAEVLERNAVPWQLIAIDAGDPVPTTLEGASALVFMGGPMSVNDPLDWIAEETHLIRTAHARRMPVLGHCLGGQLIAKALGGVVTKNGVKEIGWLPVIQTDAAVTADWLGGLPRTLDVFHWHGETFSIPDEATLILSGSTCLHQAFVAGNTMGMQCHIEMTTELVRAWTADNPTEIATPSATIQSTEAMMTNLGARLQTLHHVADRLYERWLQPLHATKVQNCS